MRAERAAAAHAAAEAEGLALVRFENSAGFKGVSRNTGRGKPFAAQLRYDGRKNNLGTFTAEDDDDALTPPALAPPVLCHCERPAAALLDGRWVRAQLVEGDFVS